MSPVAEVVEELKFQPALRILGQGSEGGLQLFCEGRESSTAGQTQHLLHNLFGNTLPVLGVGGKER